MKAKFIKEDVMGGVAAPMATLSNTPGVGNATPAATANMTTMGSGDKWGDGNMYDQNGKLKKKKGKKKGKKKINESYLLSDFQGLANIASNFNPFKILDSRRDPDFGYENVYLLLIEFEDGNPGLCIYDTKKEEFIEEPSDLEDYNTTPEKLYDQYHFIVPGFEYLDEQFNEQNINPYDKIATQFMGGKSPFKKLDSRTNTVKQEFFKEAPEPDFKLPTLDQYAKAAEHVPPHPSETRKDTRKKKVNEEEVPMEQESLKDIKAKQELEKLGIPYIYKEGPSGKHRVYIKGINVNHVVKKLKDLGWEEIGTNPEKTIKKFHKEDKELAIFADGKDLPRVTVKDVEEVADDMIESVLAKKIVSNSLEPYI